MKNIKNPVALFVILVIGLSLWIVFCVKNFDDISETIRAVVFPIAFIAAIFGLYLANKRTKTDSIRQTNESFVEASKLLGHEEVSVRQAGVYALARYAGENQHEHEQIFNTLTSFVRAKLKINIFNYINFEELIGSKKKEQKCLIEKTVGEIIKDSEKKEQEDLQVDILAVIIVLIKKNVNRKKAIFINRYSYDLSNCFLGPNFDFSNGDYSEFNFSDSIFAYSIFNKCNLSSANFIGSVFFKCNFEDVTLENTEMTKTLFYKCKFNIKDYSKFKNDFKNDNKKNNVFFCIR